MALAWDQTVAVENLRFGIRTLRGVGHETTVHAMAWDVHRDRQTCLEALRHQLSARLGVEVPVGDEADVQVLQELRVRDEVRPVRVGVAEVHHHPSRIAAPTDGCVRHALLEKSSGGLGAVPAAEGRRQGVEGSAKELTVRGQRLHEPIGIVRGVSEEVGLCGQGSRPGPASR